MEIINNTQQGYIQIIAAFFGAFFAFCFFILGETIISSLRKKKKVIAELERIEEYIALQIYFLEINIKNYEVIMKGFKLKPISICLNQLYFFPIEEFIYQKISNFKVSENILKFIIKLRLFNTNVMTFNRYLKIHSDLSKDTMLKRAEQDFLKTARENVDKIRNETSEFLTNMKKAREDISPLIAEIRLTLKLIRSFFWIRWYFLLKTKLDPEYRKKKIQELIKE
ncbi:MAG TPA: hypothetical protein VMW21_00530 [Patescibacteria group bacterium]|nr:hypothetical protein [Patescibacteria group bacterium]